MKKWSVLKPGDLIDIIAPGYPCSPQELQEGVQVFESWGYQVRYDQKILEPHSFHASEDRERFRQLKFALTNSQSKAVWCLRGGYGSNRLLPFLDQIKKPSKAKLFVGLSDITSLHVYLNQKWNWATIHGPLVDRLGKKMISKQHLFELQNLISGQLSEIIFSKLIPMNSKAKSVQNLRAGIRGGNLTVLQSALGTPYGIQLKNKILFIEDLGERGYRIDRMLEQLIQAKKLIDCCGIVFGDFTGGDEPNGKNRVWEALERFSQLHPIPVWRGIESGHGAIQRPLPLNVDVELRRVGKSFELIAQSGSKK